MTQTDFGQRKVSVEEKPALVDQVFHSVAARYDVMNDLMSLGSHRLFKRMLLQMSGVRPGHTVLDLAGGTGDVSALFARAVAGDGKQGQVILADPNKDMLSVGRDRLWNKGLTNVGFCRTPGEALPFADHTFDAACVSFGLRNFTDKDKGLAELLRVLKPGAALLVLEFSHPTHPLIKAGYSAFQKLWPAAGRAIVGDAEPYQYLVESIGVHPQQKALKQMFEDAGFEQCEYHDLFGGVAAIHRGEKPSAHPASQLSGSDNRTAAADE